MARGYGVYLQAKSSLANQPSLPPFDRWILLPRLYWGNPEPSLVPSPKKNCNLASATRSELVFKAQIRSLLGNGQVEHSVPIPPLCASLRPTPRCTHRGCKGFVCPGRASSTSLWVNCSSTWLVWHLEHYLYLWRQTLKASRWREMSEPHTAPAITEQGSRHQWERQGQRAGDRAEFLPVPASWAKGSI